MLTTLSALPVILRSLKMRRTKLDHEDQRDEERWDLALNSHPDELADSLRNQPRPGVERGDLTLSV